MNVLDHLRAAGAGEEAVAIGATLAAVLPVGRPVVVTEEVLEAARAGDMTLLVALLADEVPPESDELAAIRELGDDPERGDTLSLDEIRRAFRPK